MERGRYLVQSVLVCVECHSEKDKSRYASPIVGTPGAGGACFGSEAGLPGVLCGMNLTPDRATGLGDWTDAEILRAVREGVGRDGGIVFPMKPIRGYRHLSEADGRAMVAYLRSMEPVENAVPQSEVHLPPEVLAHLNPLPLEGPVAEPDVDDRIDYGRYLAQVAGCESCHTPVDARQQPIETLAYAGGREFQTRNGTVRSSNLTLHETGWGGRDADNFVGLFRSFADVEARAVPVGSTGQMTVMPWLSYAGMSERDLRAVFAYLESLEPIDNPVVRWEPASRDASSE